MNTLKGKIAEVKVHESLSLVRVEVNGQLFSAIVIDTPNTVDYLETGANINLIFKETEVILARGDKLNISLQNRFFGPVISVESGDLLSKVVVNAKQGAITSIITTNAVRQLEIEVGTEVTALVKTNEMMLSP
jgi:molybdate transport system regulatory protein